MQDRALSYLASHSAQMV